jgi:hypothetical protein
MKNPLFEIDIRVGETKQHLNLDTDLDIDPNNLQKEFIEQPSKFAHYASLQKFAAKRVEELEFELELVYATLYKKIIDATDKKPTETAIKQGITLDENYGKIRLKIIEMKHLHELLKIGRYAFEQRKDMLIQVGSMTMQEMNSEISTLKNKVLKKMKGEN